jgi:hypothetical protein
MGQDNDIRLTFMTTIKPFMLLREVTVRIDAGKLCSIQTKSEYDFLSVMVGIAWSMPSTTSPRKSGQDCWSKEVPNKKLVIVSAPKHWKPREVEIAGIACTQLSVSKRMRLNELTSGMLLVERVAETIQLTIYLAPDKVLGSETARLENRLEIKDFLCGNRFAQ